MMLTADALLGVIGLMFIGATAVPAIFRLMGLRR